MAETIAETIKGHPATTGDDYQLNTTKLLTQAIASAPGQKIWFRKGEAWEHYTYADLGRRARQIANALTGLGAKPGDVIGIFDWNSKRHNELYWAIPGTGAAMLQMNLRLTPADLNYVVENSGATRICVDESLLAIAEALDGIATAPIQWLVMSDRPVADIAPKLRDVVDFEQIVAAASDEYVWPVIDEKSAFSGCYTTGTTGRPKGVFYSHRSIVLHTMAIANELRVTSNDVTFLVTPMFHVTCWGFPQLAVYSRAEVVLPGRFLMTDAEFIVDAFVSRKVTVANGAPAIFGPVLEYIRGLEVKPDLSNARLVSGSTEPPLALIRGFFEATGATVVHGYGATETSPIVSLNNVVPDDVRERLSEDELWDLRRCQGIPSRGLDVEILGANGEFLPHDGEAVGEIIVRGPWITSSYHAVDLPDSFHKGYWRSGDVGLITADGYIKVTDRLKDVVKSGGEWISSIDMENLLVAHPKIREACVIGVPHEKWQERPLPLVVSTNVDAPISVDEVREWLGKSFANWQLPDRVEIVESLPRTSVGKLDKKVLRVQYQDVYAAATQ